VRCQVVEYHLCCNVRLNDLLLNVYESGQMRGYLQVSNIPDSNALDILIKDLKLMKRSFISEAHPVSDINGNAATLQTCSTLINNAELINSRGVVELANMLASTRRNNETFLKAYDAY